MRDYGEMPRRAADRESYRVKGEIDSDLSARTQTSISIRKPPERAKQNSASLIPALADGKRASNPIRLVARLVLRCATLNYWCRLLSNVWNLTTSTTYRDDAEGISGSYARARFEGEVAERKTFPRLFFSFWR